MRGQTLVLDNADVVPAEIRMMNKTCLLATAIVWLSACSGNVSVHIESEKSPPDIPTVVYVSAKCGLDEAFPWARLGNAIHPQFSWSRCFEFTINQIRS